MILEQRPSISSLRVTAKYPRSNQVKSSLSVSCKALSGEHLNPSSDEAL
jgi:hypothetical protein